MGNNNYTCRVCGALNDCGTHVGEGSKVPEPGTSLMICIKCGDIALLTEEGLVALPDKVLDNLPTLALSQAHRIRKIYLDAKKLREQ